MREALGTKLRELRKQKRMLQVDVAVAVGISRSTLSAIETGGDLPGRELLRKLADFYGVSVDELYPRRSAAGGKPEALQFVKDEDEAALLSFWRQLDEAGKRLFLLALTRGRDGG